MVKFHTLKNAGFGLALWLGLNALLYNHSWIDKRIVPQKGNVIHGFIFREAVKQGAGRNVVQAAQAGNPLAAQVLQTHSKEFTDAARGV